jgi:hypothetical protein
MGDLDNGNSLSVIGIYLTLVGLLGSFFYIHVGEWYRDVRALVTDWRRCRLQRDDEDKAEARRCKGELSRLALVSILWTVVPVMVFMVIISLLALGLYRQLPDPSWEWWYVIRAWVTFMAVFFGLSGLLLALGGCALSKLRPAMYPNIKENWLSRVICFRKSKKRRAKGARRAVTAKTPPAPPAG